MIHFFHNGMEFWADVYVSGNPETDGEFYIEKLRVFQLHNGAPDVTGLLEYDDFNRDVTEIAYREWKRRVRHECVEPEGAL